VQAGFVVAITGRAGESSVLADSSMVLPEIDASDCARRCPMRA
jgi:hypothetical protein